VSRPIIPIRNGSSPQANAATNNPTVPIAVRILIGSEHLRFEARCRARRRRLWTAAALTPLSLPLKAGNRVPGLLSIPSHSAERTVFTPFHLARGLAPVYADACSSPGLKRLDLILLMQLLLPAMSPRQGHPNPKPRRLAMWLSWLLLPTLPVTMFSAEKAWIADRIGDWHDPAANSFTSKTTD